MYGDAPSVQDLPKQTQHAVHVPAWMHCAIEDQREAARFQDKINKERNCPPMVFDKVKGKEDLFEVYLRHIGRNAREIFRSKLSIDDDVSRCLSSLLSEGEDVQEGGFACT